VHMVILELFCTIPHWGSPGSTGVKWGSNWSQTDTIRDFVQRTGLRKISFAPLQHTHEFPLLQYAHLPPHQVSIKNVTERRHLCPGCCNFAGITLDDLPHVQAWMKRIEERPAVKRGIDVPEPFDKEASKDPKKVQEAIDMVRKFTGTHSSEL